MLCDGFGFFERAFFAEELIEGRTAASDIFLAAVTHFNPRS